MIAAATTGFDPRRLDRITRIRAEWPVFAVEGNGRRALYARGHLAAQHADSDERADAERMWNAIGAARIGAGEFRPECLTLYLTNRCALACRYCFSSGDRPAADEAPPVEAIRAAAELVADGCAAAGRPFQLALHGGGEPTSAWPLLQTACAVTREVAGQRHLPWRCYLATNGRIPEARVRWIAAHIDHVGISCDGPPDIHDLQRSTGGGRPTSRFVERTARLLRDAGVRLTTRATITRESAPRLPEIAEYLAGALGASEIRLEPVYGLGADDPLAFPATERAAREFIAQVLAAERVARARGIPLHLAGVRPDDPHGPFCNPLRASLQMTPDGGFSACFRCSRALAPVSKPWRIGSWNRATARCELDAARIADFQRAGMRRPPRCAGCPAVEHCAGDCPDRCVADNDWETAPPGFRCMVQRGLVEHWIAEWIDQLPHRVEKTDANRAMTKHLANLPAHLDADLIHSAWRKARTRWRDGARRMPSPPWDRRAFCDDPPTAWQHIGRAVGAAAPEAPISVYLHVPLCDTRCAFCDCYSLASDRAGRHAAALTDALVREIEQWSAWRGLAARPVTTVHFGGGSPMSLGVDALSRVTATLRRHLGITPDTEWALESTSRALDAPGLDALFAMGFRRLHVGVQTLEDDVRRGIGRREVTETVCARIRAARERGFLTTADAVYGLPGQTLAGWVRSVETLADLGLPGLSLYQFQHTARNRRFVERRCPGGRDAMADFVALHAAEQALRARGFAKNHYTHFAQPADRNLYYTYPRRGEDLLSLGPIANGEFDGYHYRHREFLPYLEDVNRGRIGLEGGRAETVAERRAAHAAAVLSGGYGTRPELGGGMTDGVWADWLTQDLVETGSGRDTFTLTANGSWWIADLLQEIGVSP